MLPMEKVMTECVSPAGVARCHAERVILIVKLPSVPIDQSRRIVHETGRWRKMILGTKRFIIQGGTWELRHFSKATSRSPTLKQIYGFHNYNAKRCTTILYSLTPPEVSPPIMNLWQSRNIVVIGIPLKTANAANRPQSFS